MRTLTQFILFQNMSSSIRKHAPPAEEAPHVPEPSFSERARTLLHLGRTGTLATLSRKQPGFPFASVMPYAADGQGRSIFLISTMAMHTQNLQADPRASLLVAQEDSGSDPLGAGRVTLIGKVQRIPEADIPAARDLYLARHENSRYWVDFEDFHFYRMEVIDLYYVGGFGVMGWVEPPDYAQAGPDPLADSAVGILEHMNADHSDALVLLARAFAGIEAEQATMTSVDRLGFNVRLKTPERIRGARIAFLREVRDPNETRKVLVEMVQQARKS
jgi:putative heme iron utilization protein